MEATGPPDQTQTMEISNVSVVVAPHDPGPKTEGLPVLRCEKTIISSLEQVERDAYLAEGTSEDEDFRMHRYRQHLERNSGKTRVTVSLCPKGDPFTYIRIIKDIIANDHEIGDYRVSTDKAIRNLYRHFGMENSLETWPQGRYMVPSSIRKALAISLFGETARKICGDFTLSNLSPPKPHQDRLIALLEICGSIILNEKALSHTYVGKGPGLQGETFLSVMEFCTDYTSDIISDLQWGKDNASVTVHYTDGEKITHHLEPPGIDFFKGFTQINVKK